jgi:thioredoxin 1
MQPNGGDDSGTTPAVPSPLPAGEASSLDASPLELSDDTFDSAVINNGLMMIDFWAPWCSPCRAIAPILEEVVRDSAGKLVLAKLNVDENPATPSRFGVQGIPTIFITKRGEILDYIVGVVPKAELVQRIQPFL